ncbi:MAG: peptidoglycan DD-metalloendopeptidase family protein [Bacteroidales bacterium]
MMRFLLILLIVGLGFSARSQSKNELEERKQSTLKEIEIAKALLDQTKSRKDNTVKRVAVLNSGIRARERLIATILSEIDKIDGDIDNLEQEIAKLEKDIAKGKEEYSRIIYSIYVNHTEEEKMMYLLASESINQFYQRIKYMKYLKDYRVKKVSELESLVSVKERLTSEMLQARNSKALLLEEKAAENRVLVRERNDRSGMLKQLTQDEQRIQKEIQDKERIRKELEDKIRRIIEEEAKRRSAGSLVMSLTPEQQLLGNSFMQNRGRLPWPVERGVVTANFGVIDHPVLPGVKISNNGIDISTVSGSKARAVFDGEVTSVFAILGANYAVIVMHGEYLSVYQNLENLKVKAGDKVITKQEIGSIHSDEGEDMAVLHLQIWKSKEILDPNRWLSN